MTIKDKLSNEDFYKIKYLSSEGSRLSILMNSIQTSFLKTKEDIDDNKKEYSSFNDELKKKYNLTDKCSFDFKTGEITRVKDDDVSKPTPKKS